jgi:hypothetical protein
MSYQPTYITIFVASVKDESEVVGYFGFESFQIKQFNFPWLLRDSRHNCKFLEVRNFKYPISTRK